MQFSFRNNRSGQIRHFFILRNHFGAGYGWRSRAHPGLRCILRGPSWATGDTQGKHVRTLKILLQFYQAVSRILGCVEKVHLANVQFDNFLSVDTDADPQPNFRDNSGLPGPDPHLNPDRKHCLTIITLLVPYLALSLSSRTSCTRRGFPVAVASYTHKKILNNCTMCTYNSSLSSLHLLTSYFDKLTFHLIQVLWS